jgi:hypothetical protein
VASPSLGTVTGDGSVIITHNHFGNEAARERMEIENADGSLIGTYEREYIQRNTSLLNAQTRRIQLPAVLKDVTPARLGCSQDLVVGDGVSIAYQIGSGVGIYHDTIIDIGWPGDEDGNVIVGAVLSAWVDNSAGVIRGGDSGGGWFVNGELIGNTWSVGGRAGAKGALLP